MTDRVCGFVVVLDENLRVDDAKRAINAIKMIRGVVAVSPVAADADEQTAEIRVRYELRERLLRLFDEG